MEDLADNKGMPTGDRWYLSGGLYDEAPELSLDDKVERAVTALRVYEPKALELDRENGYHLCFSGGKDSVVIKRLAQMSGVRFESWYSQTTIDPPELVRFIRRHHPDVRWIRPKKPFFSRMPDKNIPTRMHRWCCDEYKEQGGKGKVKIIGVRSAESPRRQEQWEVWMPWRGGAYCLCPILKWTDEDVWAFIHKNDLPYCSLYDEKEPRFTRLGCVGCPLAGDARWKEFARWPQFERLWRKAVYAWYERHKGKLTRKGTPYKLATFSTPEGLWKWWMTGGKYTEPQVGESEETLFGEEGEQCTMGQG